MSHLNRSVPTANADPSRTRLNRVLYGDKSRSIEDLAISAYKRAGLDPKGFRKDATLANDIVMSISPAWFRPDDPDRGGSWDENRLNVFVAESLKYLQKGFGPRLLRVDLHLDEATPHIHAVVVPIMPTSDKSRYRLSGKDMFNPERLTAMQDAWERVMSRHGVGPRLKGSTARHTKLKDYYSAIASMEVDQNLKNVTVTTPPKKGVFETGDAHRQKVEDWKKAEAKRLQEELQPLVQAAAKGRLYDAERLAAQAARSDATVTRHNWADLATRFSDLSDELKLSKEAINQLRGADIKAVADRLEWTGAMPRNRNAIDLVKAATGFDFQQATAWLYEEFGAETVGTAVAQKVEEAPKRAPLTPADRTKLKAVAKQLDAIDAPAYRVTCALDAQAWNFGKRDKSLGRDGLTAVEIKERIPELARINAAGGNVYVTPLDPIHHHILIDDLTRDGLQHLKGRGYTPEIAVETSPGSIQALLRVPRALLGESAPEGQKMAVNEFFKDLNRDLGDGKIVGLEHPLRLAGFSNRKPKHERNGKYPFVRLLEATSVTCHKAVEVCRVYMRQKLLDLSRKPTSGFTLRP